MTRTDQDEPPATNGRGLRRERAIEPRQFLDGDIRPLFGRSISVRWRAEVLGDERNGVRAAVLQHKAALALWTSLRQRGETLGAFADRHQLEAEVTRRKLRGETWASLRDVAPWQLDIETSTHPGPTTAATGDEHADDTLPPDADAGRETSFRPMWPIHQIGQHSSGFLLIGPSRKAEVVQRSGIDRIAGIFGVPGGHALRLVRQLSSDLRARSAVRSHRRRKTTP